MVFRYLLQLRDGEPNDPAVFRTPTPIWNVDDVITSSTGDRLRVVALGLEVPYELVQCGFHGVFTVEPVDG